MHGQKVFGTILNKVKVDLLVSGHTRQYGIDPKVESQHIYPIVIGGPKEGSRTIIRVKADEASFALKMLGNSRQVVDNK